jgi:hypothetical protein
MAAKLPLVINHKISGYPGGKLTVRFRLCMSMGMNIWMHWLDVMH